MKKIILVGAGGHAKSCIDIIEKISHFKIIGLIDKKFKKKRINNYPLVKFKKVKKKNKNISYLLICIGQIVNSNLRKKLFKEGISKGYKFTKIISPNSYVSPKAKIGNGTIVMHGAIVNAGAVIGKNCIINSKSLIEHDVTVGDHCHISTGAILNGGVSLKDDSFVGSGSIIKEGVKIGKKTIIPGNVFVNKNLKGNLVYKK